MCVVVPTQVLRLIIIAYSSWRCVDILIKPDVISFLLKAITLSFSVYMQYTLLGQFMTPNFICVSEGK